MNAPARTTQRALLAGCLLAASCGDQRDPAPPDPAKPTGEVRALNELSLVQLRVMLKGFPGDWRNDTDQSKGLPEPPPRQALPEGVPRIDLVPVERFTLGGGTLRDAIASRRSVREFSPTPLTQEELSFLLWSTQGITAVGHDETGEIAHRFRAAPSGGGRYPFETYLVVNRVEGLAAGVYRYLPDEHQLARLREASEISAELRTACYGQDFVADAAVTFVWAAVPERTEWKYAYLSARMIAMEAGHICQNLYLAATGSGSGCCALLAYDQASVDRLLGVDGEDEFAVYLACVGKPSTASQD